MRPIFAFAVLLSLASCVNSTVYYAEGVSTGARAADFAQCEAQALIRYPVRNEIRYTPRQYVPPRSFCNAEGDCRIVPGYFEGGDPYTVDINRDFRRNAVRGCMGERGYDPISLPACPPDQAVSLSPIMPPLTEGSCILRQNGERLIVNPV